MNRHLLALMAFTVLGLFSSIAYATDPVTYYIRLDGNDVNSGLTNTSAGAWKTLAKVNATSLNAGDVVHLGTGVFGSAQNDTALVVPSSGTAALPITFEGEGADKTVISAAKAVTTWFKSNDVPDVSGNNRTGVNYGAVLGVAGTTDTTGYSFDGVDDYIDTGGDWIGTGDVTISMWMYPKSLSTASRFFTNTISITGATPSMTAVLSVSGILSLYSGGSAAVSSGSLSKNKWQHLTITVSADSLVRFYINGLYSTADSSCGTRFAGQRNVSIGNTTALASGFDGLIRDVQIRNIVVTSAQADSIYKGTIAASATLTNSYPMITAYETAGNNPLLCNWQTATTDSVYAMWNAGVSMTRVMTKAECDANNEFFLHIGPALNPNDYLFAKLTTPADTSSIWRSKKQGIDATGKSYLTIQNMRVMYGSGGAPTYSGTANIRVTGTSPGLTIANCVIDSGVYVGIHESSKNSIIKNTIVKYNKIGIYAIVDSISVYNCTLINNTISNLRTYFSGPPNYLNVKNCIFSQTISGGTFITIDSPASIYTLSNNLFYSTTGYGNKWKRGSTTFSTLASWADSTGQESGSLTGDPLFVNESLGNYRLNKTSPAINAGVDVGLTSDFDGNPIYGIPDIGAYEWQKDAVKRYIYKNDFIPLYKLDLIPLWKR